MKTYIVDTVKKYRKVKICPIPSKGYSTGFAPIHVKIKRVVRKNQKMGFFLQENLDVLFFCKTIGKKISMEAANATTPPSLEGIERKIT